jgi:hypothetical protein
MGIKFLGLAVLRLNLLAEGWMSLVPWTLVFAFGLIAATDIDTGTMYSIYTAVLLGLAGFRLHRTNFEPTFLKIDSLFLLFISR